MSMKLETTLISDKTNEEGYRHTVYEINGHHVETVVYRDPRDRHRSYAAGWSLVPRGNPLGIKVNLLARRYPEVETGVKAALIAAQRHISHNPP